MIGLHPTHDGEAVCVFINLIFGELSLQTQYILSSFCDLRLQTGGVSHLWILLVHTLHLLQCIAEVKQKKSV